MRKYFYILFALTFIGCTKPTVDLPKIVVDVKDIQSSAPLSVIFDSLKYIPLETTKESLFKDIDKLCMDSQGNFYILDREGVNAIYKFDQQGKFKGQIGSYGKGPREYMNISDFCLYQDSIVEIYDSEREKRILYTTSGKFITEKNNWKMGGAKFIHLGDTVAFYASCGGYAPNLYLYINEKEYGFFKQDYPEMRDKFEYFHLDGNKLYYSDNYNDTLYHFIDGKMAPYLYVDFQKNKLPKEIRENYKAKQEDFCYNIDEIRFSSKYIYFSFGYKGVLINAFWDKQQNKSNLISMFINDIDGIPFPFNMVGQDANDKFIININTNIFISIYEDCKKNGTKTSQTFDKLIQQIDENSNPVIVLAYTKK